MPRISGNTNFFQNVIRQVKQWLLQKLPHNTFKTNVAISSLSQISGTEIALLFGGQRNPTLVVRPVYHYCNSAVLSVVSIELGCAERNQLKFPGLRPVTIYLAVHCGVAVQPCIITPVFSNHELSTEFFNWLYPHEVFHGGRPAWFFITLLSEDYKSSVGDSLERKHGWAKLARASLKHVRERKFTRRNPMRRAANFRVGDRAVLHLSPLPSWPRNCLQDPFFGPYLIMRIDGSRIHGRCSRRLGGRLLCAPNHLTHYHSPDELSWDGCCLSDREEEHIDPQNAANLEESDKLEEMTADEMAVHGY